MSSLYSQFQLNIHTKFSPRRLIYICTDLCCTCKLAIQCHFQSLYLLKNSPSVSILLSVNFFTQHIVNYAHCGKFVIHIVESLLFAAVSTYPLIGSLKLTLMSSLYSHFEHIVNYTNSGKLSLPVCHFCYTVADFCS